MRVDIDTAGHHDFAGDVISVVDGATHRLRNDAIIFDEEIADARAVPCRVDDPPAAKASQHAAAPGRICSVICSRTDAALGNPAASLTRRPTSDCVSRAKSTPL